MNLFEILPSNLFSILSSKNKHIYADALFVLRKTFKQEMSIAKRDLAAMIVANLEEELMDIDLFEDPENNAAQEETDSLYGMAYFLIRKLRETKWLEIEYGTDSFEEFVTLPDYSIRLINLLYSFTEENVSEYNSYVYSTYSALKTANMERDEFMFNALSTAYDNTIRLIDEIKTLHNNIRRYHQNLSQISDINDILKGHFDDFKALVADRVYHPLKTLDSVPRFKAPIIKILNEWTVDGALRKKICHQLILRGKFSNESEAMEEVLFKIREIMDSYEKLEGMLEEVDKRTISLPEPPSTKCDIC